MSVDTLSLAKELRAAELSSTQAEAIAAAIGRAVVEGAATKMDVQALRSDLSQDIQALRSDLTQDIQALRGDLLQVEAKLETKIEHLRSTLMVWFIGTILTLATIIVAAAKL